MSKMKVTKRASKKKGRNARSSGMGGEAGVAIFEATLYDVQSMIGLAEEALRKLAPAALAFASVEGSISGAKRERRIFNQSLSETVLALRCVRWEGRKALKRHGYVDVDGAMRRPANPTRDGTADRSAPAATEQH